MFIVSHLNLTLQNYRNHSHFDYLLHATDKSFFRANISSKFKVVKVPASFARIILHPKTEMRLYLASKSQFNVIHTNETNNLDF